MSGCALTKKKSLQKNWSLSLFIIRVNIPLHLYSIEWSWISLPSVKAAENLGDKKINEIMIIDPRIPQGPMEIEAVIDMGK